MEVNGIKYHVEVVGEGDPLLVLHGFTGSIQSWNPFIEEWSKQFTLILVDLLGHGQTDHPPDSKRYSTECATLDLQTILNTLGVGKTHVLGYSMGGRLALSFTIMFPNSVQSLILESSSPGLSEKKERTDREANDYKLASKIEQEGIEAFIDYWEGLPLFRSQQDILSFDKRQRLRRERLKNDVAGLGNSLRGFGTGVQPSWWEHLQTLQIPVLLIVGEDDKKFCRINNEMNKRLPNSKIIVVKDAGHTIHLEQPEIFGKIVMDYLKGKLNIK